MVILIHKYFSNLDFFLFKQQVIGIHIFNASSGDQKRNYEESEISHSLLFFSWVKQKFN